MSKYIAGPSVLRFPGKPAVLPGQPFEHTFETAPEEALALASGSVALQPGETSLADQIVARLTAEADERAAVKAAAPPTVAAVEPVEPIVTEESKPSEPAISRVTGE